MFLIRLTLILLIGVLLSSCSSDEPAAGSLDSGRAPEWVVKKYQQFVDQNQFQYAKELSTPAEQARLDKLAAVMVSESLTESILTTKFLQINCDLEGKVNYCQCLVEDEYERYEMVFKLVRARGQWLVDAPEGEDVGEGEVIDGVLNGMREIMQ